MPDSRSAGRIVGALLVFLIIGGVVGNFVLVAPVFAAPGYLVNAAAHPWNLSLSALVGIATGAIALGIAITAFPVLRRHAEPLALWLLALAILNFALAAVEQVALLSLLSLSNAYNGTAAPDEDPVPGTARCRVRGAELGALRTPRDHRRDAPRAFQRSLSLRTRAARPRRPWDHRVFAPDRGRRNATLRPTRRLPAACADGRGHARNRRSPVDHGVQRPVPGSPGRARMNDVSGSLFHTVALLDAMQRSDAESAGDPLRDVSQ